MGVLHNVWYLDFESTLHLAWKEAHLPRTLRVQQAYVKGHSSPGGGTASHEQDTIKAA